MAQLSILAIIVSMQGCAVVQVSSRNTAQSLIEQRDSILTRNRISEASVGMLSGIGLAQTSCLQHLESCLQQLQSIPSTSDEQYLSTASELYLLHAEQFLAKRPECQPLPIVQNPTDHTVIIRFKKQADSVPVYDMTPVKNCQQQRQQALLSSISHAYAYLFASQRPAQQRLFDNRQVQVRDFYNVAVSRFVAEQFNGQPEQAIQDLQLNDSQISIDVQDQGKLFGQQQPEQLVAADELSFSGLRTVNRRDGFGVEFVAVMPKQQIDSIGGNISGNAVGTAHHIYRSRYLPISIVMRPIGESAEQMLQSHQFKLDIYNPYQQTEAKISANSTQNLAANFSAPYGLWLAQNNLAEVAYRSLLALDEAHTEPKLYLLEPYQPNKRVIILLHGLASSPEAWVNLTNDIFGDPVLRQGYQVWQVFYPTNMPMLESRLKIQQLIEQTYQQVDPQRQHRASQQSVLIGHSMGGVIGRLLLSNTDLSATAFTDFNSQERQRLLQIPEVKHYFQLKALPQVQRAVFVSSPFRGTDYADRWFTLALRNIIRLPVSFIKAIDDAMVRARIDEQLMQRITEVGLLDFQNGASELSQQSRFMQITSALQMKNGLPYHSIMGQIAPTAQITDSSDGIVPYRSSHLEGAVSEKLIEGGHSIQSSPAAVLELRRILRLHLEKIGDVTSQSVHESR